MNQGIHLYAVSARLLEAVHRAGELIGDTSAGLRGSLRTAMDALGQADRSGGPSPQRCHPRTNTSRPHANCMVL